MGVFSVVFRHCLLSIKLVLSNSTTREKPSPTQIKTITVRPIYRDTCPFDYYFRSILIIYLTPYSILFLLRTCQFHILS